MKTIAEYQVEHAAWTARQPWGKDQHPRQCHLGLIEEVGELAHSLLKQEQHIRGDAAKHEEAAKDAVGDILIYLLGFCNSVGVALVDCLAGGIAGGWQTFAAVQESFRSEKQHHLADYHVRDCSKALTGVWQKSDWEIEGLVVSLARLCCLRGWDLQDIFERTWSGVVEKRDWAADAVSGGT